MTSSRYLGNATSQVTIEWQPPLARGNPILGYYVKYNNDAYHKQQGHREDVKWAVSPVSQAHYVCNGIKF